MKSSVVRDVQFPQQPALQLHDLRVMVFEFHAKAQRPVIIGSRQRGTSSTINTWSTTKPTMPATPWS